jgi:hypothetical protein
MNAKEKLLKQVEALEKEKAVIARRREELSRELAEKQAAIKNAGENLGENLLAGRKASAEVVDLARDEHLLKGLKDAISLADRKLRKFDDEIGDITYEINMSDFDATSKEAAQLVVGYMKKSREYLKEFEPIERAYRELNEIAEKKVGQKFRAETHQHYLIVQSFFNNMRGYGGVIARIKRLDELVEARIKGN